MSSESKFAMDLSDFARRHRGVSRILTLGLLVELLVLSGCDTSTAEIDASQPDECEFVEVVAKGADGRVFANFGDSWYYVDQIGRVAMSAIPQVEANPDQLEGHLQRWVTQQIEAAGRGSIRSTEAAQWSSAYSGSAIYFLFKFELTEGGSPNGAAFMWKSGSFYRRAVIADLGEPGRSSHILGLSFLVHQEGVLELGANFGPE